MSAQQTQVIPTGPCPDCPPGQSRIMHAKTCPRYSGPSWYQYGPPWLPAQQG
jgi:hypothetical protein